MFDCIEICIRDGDLLVCTDMDAFVHNIVDVIGHAGAVASFEKDGPGMVVDVNCFFVRWMAEEIPAEILLVGSRLRFDPLGCKHELRIHAGMDECAWCVRSAWVELRIIGLTKVSFVVVAVLLAPWIVVVFPVVAVVHSPFFEKVRNATVMQQRWLYISMRQRVAAAVRRRIGGGRCVDLTMHGKGVRKNAEKPTGIDKTSVRGSCGHALSVAVCVVLSLCVLLLGVRCRCVVVSCGRSCLILVHAPCLCGVVVFTLFGVVWHSV